MEEMARPTKYDVKFIDDLYDFIDRPLYETIEKEVLTNRGEILMLKEERANMTPTIEGLAIHLKVNKSSIYEWAKIYPEFSHALDALRQRTKEFLNYHALLGNYSSGYAKFFATNATDMVDKKETFNENKNISISISEDDASL